MIPALPALSIGAGFLILGAVVFAVIMVLLALGAARE